MGRSVKLGSPLDFSVFIPSVMILDENFNVVNVIKSSHFPYSEDSFGANLYKGTFSLPDGYTKLYLLIYTTAKDASGSTVMTMNCYKIVCVTTGLLMLVNFLS
nr:malM protein homolog [Raoultella sp. NCTC 9187]